jgi:hypothetical protein
MCSLRWFYHAQCNTKPMLKLCVAGEYVTLLQICSSCYEIYPPTTSRLDGGIKGAPNFKWVKQLKVFFGKKITHTHINEAATIVK